MDMKKILEILESFNPEVEAKEVVTDYKEHPKYFIIMFKKTLVEYNLISKDTIKLIRKAEPQLEEEDLRKAGDHLTYNRAFNYLLKLDLANKFHFETFIDEKNLELIKLLNDTLEYFEKVEDYEKCIKVKDFLDNLV